MFDYSYERDYKNNYLVIPNNKVINNSFQLKMIIKNDIKGLLRCKERLVNGEGMICYEITSKQPLSNIWKNRLIKYDDVKKLFQALRKVIDDIHKYILYSEDLILSPEFIFYDLDAEDYYFLYHPFREGDTEGLFELFNFLTENLDNDDNEAVETVYRAFNMVQNSQCSVETVLDGIIKDIDMFDENSEDNDTPIPDENPDYDESSDEDSYLEDVHNKSFFVRIWEFFFGEKDTENKNKSCSGYRERKEGKTFGKQNHYTEDDEYYGREDDEKDDVTVFIPWNENSENKLYGVGRNNKNHIDLGRLPITVGKLSSAVDISIQDNSLSRMHVRFFKEGGRISMTDLNSTNGTFKNGMRLRPNETVIIEPGDEIGIGKLKFMYR